MTIRSKLFATVAMPVLAASMVVHPALAANLAASFEVAQAEDPSQSNEEELLRQQQQQAEEAARAAEQQAAEQQAAEQRAAEEAAAAAAQQQAEQEAEQQRQLQEQQAAEQKAAEDAAAAAAAAQQAAEQKAAEDAAAAAQQAADQKAAEDAAAAAAAEQQAAEQKAAEDAAAAEKQAAEQKAAADAAAAEQQATEQKAADDAAATAAAEKQAAEQKAAEDAATAEKQATDQKAADDAAAAAATEQQRLADEQKAAEQKAAEDAQKAQEQQPAPAVEPPATAEQPATNQQPVVEGQPPATEGQPATAEQPQTDPAVEQPQQTSETPVQPAVVPEIVDTTTPEQKQEIAADPAKTDETIVLPIEDGAAVLDSDKDADNAGGQTAREERKKLRENQRAEETAVAPPANDADAQAEITKVESEAIQAAITEQGQKLDAVPVFVTPGVTNVENNTVNNTIINNNVTNNVTNNITNVVVQQQIDNRTVLSVDNQIIIRNDDRPRLRRDSEESFYEELSRGRVRETIVRPNGSRLVTVYDRYGDIIQRSRIDRDGEEYLMVYAPEPEADRPPRIRDIGYELPPMRLRIPVRDYIIDTSSEPDRDYYDFLAEPPVEQVERVYSIDEVKYSARLRDKVRRIDLDTITFATGSSEVPLAQAKTLRKVANAISEVLEKDQGETFLIEGHTDAVGKDQPNLVLSDQRAEAVAELLTDVYGIPPENLVTQGYGERFLKVKTQVAEQQNRRVTIRRVTPLVRPVAQK